MTPPQLVLDTDVVIDLLKKVPAVMACFLELVARDTRFLISPVVVGEIKEAA